MTELDEYSAYHRLRCELSQLRISLDRVQKTVEEHIKQKYEKLKSQGVNFE